MTAAATVALLLAFVAALIDWRAVAREAVIVESFAKPLVMVALAITALLIDVGWELRGPLLIALVLSLAGDILLLPSVDRFLGGLAAFLGAHVAYAAVFVELGVTTVVVIGVLVVLAGVSALIVRRFRGGPQLAVLAYVAVLTIMAALAAGTGVPLTILGAALFVASDATLGWNRFAEPLRHGRLITHVLYHVGQALILVGVATA